MNRYAWQLLLLVILLALIAAGKNLARAGATSPSGLTSNKAAATASTAGHLFGLAAAQTAVLVNAGQSVCLTFDTGTAAYTFKACIPGGFTLTGTGTVQTIGGVAVLTDNKPDRRVQGFFYLNTQTGHASVTQIAIPGIFNSLSINSTFPNPTCGCP